MGKKSTSSQSGGGSYPVLPPDPVWPPSLGVIEQAEREIANKRAERAALDADIKAREGEVESARLSRILSRRAVLRDFVQNHPKAIFAFAPVHWWAVDNRLGECSDDVHLRRPDRCARCFLLELSEHAGFPDHMLVLAVEGMRRGEGGL